MILSKPQLDQFDRDGFLVLEDFIEPYKFKREAEEILKNELSTQKLSDLHAFPAYAHGEPSAADFDYFINSGQSIRLFLNTDIKEDEFPEEFQLKMIRQMGCHLGHALHALDPVFREFVLSKQVRQVAKSFGFSKPLVCQSMYLMRQDFTSHTVGYPHQMASFLQVDPPSKQLGFWLAMDDLTEEFGAIQFIPGSHKRGLVAQFARNPDKKAFEQGKRLVFTKEPDMQYQEEEFVAVPLKAGSGVLVNSMVVHRSVMSDKAYKREPKHRDAFAFHIYDSENSTYRAENWMQYSEETFLPLY